MNEDIISATSEDVPEEEDNKWFILALALYTKSGKKMTALAHRRVELLRRDAAALERFKVVLEDLQRPTESGLVALPSDRAKAVLDYVLAA
ncbi:MAG: hypothetical protein JSS66_05035 [Armatimonadetes bacterium]|nr:hypothetical protein [Armatimonadota bacterium]